MGSIEVAQRQTLCRTRPARTDSSERTLYRGVHDIAKESQHSVVSVIGNTHRVPKSDARCYVFDVVSPSTGVESEVSAQACLEQDGLDREEIHGEDVLHLPAHGVARRTEGGHTGFALIRTGGHSRESRGTQAG